jgi:D-serine deaminase-like pyridoxal phosphate-dependent protein
MHAPLNLEPLLREPVDWRFRAFPDGRGKIRIGDVPAQGWKLFDSGFLFPVMVLKESAVEHNLRLLARFCADRGVSLAPHGKTTMAPQLFARQLAAGAWGMTAATVEHARVYRAFGVTRILLANEVVWPDEARWVLAEMSADPGLEFFCYVDSTAGARALSQIFAAAPRPLPVLVELGATGGRGGCRTLEEAISLTGEIAAAPGLALAGVAGYEGILAVGRTPDSLATVDAFCDRLAELARELLKSGASGDGELLVSAGGSAYPDRVVEQLSSVSDGNARVRIVIRPGCYLTHDDGIYERVSPFSGRDAPSSMPRLRSALELWGAVLSRPEPGRAIIGFGKRDAPFDADLPVPRAVRDRSGRLRRAESMSIARLNDQHAYLTLLPGDPLLPGDLLCCGVSHPCLAFDKWSLLPLVDDEYNVVDAIRTYF